MGFDASRFREGDGAALQQYPRQLERLRREKKETVPIERAVEGALKNLTAGTPSKFVIYGEPQSGKTEMMICLSARLLDEGRLFLLHLLNDSVDLLGQNLGRFQKSGLAPSAKNYTDILDPGIPIKGRKHVVFCKKNARDLEKLQQKIGQVDRIVVIDDEADYASPNAKVNKKSRTRINGLIHEILGKTGDYIGVTATPARLDLNNTFGNDSALWVRFPPHTLYTGHETFFPLDVPNTPVPYRRTLLKPNYDAPKFARQAFFGFLVSVANLNSRPAATEQNYSLLIHTSGKRVDHKADWYVFDKAVAALINRKSSLFDRYAEDIWTIAAKRHGEAEAEALTSYILDNISRYAIFVLNSEREFIQNGLSATNPSALFTIIIGGNIVSRGVTFENLLSMFFTRDVKHKMQQDTYIQRARMFGSRGKYLDQFELTIPAPLFEDWRRCFVFHQLALASIDQSLGSPVWLTDARISAVAASSIDRSTVDVDRGEMSFHLFDHDGEYDAIVNSAALTTAKLHALSKRYADAVFPCFLKEYILKTAEKPEEEIALHAASSIENYTDGKDVDKKLIQRRRGFMGATQLERTRFPAARHHLKVFYNADHKARLFYKSDDSVQFARNNRA